VTAFAEILLREFSDEIGKAVMEAQMRVIPDEWKPDVSKKALKYNGVDDFHRPGIVYAVELVVAVPLDHKYPHFV
jgi:hypothetical protein